MWPDESGLTVAEVVVIVAIVGILGVTAFGSLGNILQVTQSKGAAEEVAAAIRLARQYAITRGANHCIQFVGGTPNTAFRIREAATTTSCAGTNVLPPAGTTPDYARIGHGLAVVNPADLAIVFDGVGNVKNFAPGNPTVTLEVDTNPHSCTNNVLVTLYGGVRVSQGSC
ncbi:MAG: hypothetical protein HY002_10865 [Candidatus Rokubacteria bacterium]|nr:hypothetical protein [Candidatus Rokubacteria bacterium]